MPGATNVVRVYGTSAVGDGAGNKPVSGIIDLNRIRKVAIVMQQLEPKQKNGLVVVLTGRDAHPDICDRADTVTELTRHGAAHGDL